MTHLHLVHCESYLESTKQIFYLYVLEQIKTMSQDHHWWIVKIFMVPFAFRERDIYLFIPYFLHFDLSFDTFCSSSQTRGKLVTLAQDYDVVFFTKDRLLKRLSSPLFPNSKQMEFLFVMSTYKFVQITIRLSPTNTL